MNDSRTIKQTNPYRPGRAARGAAAVTAQYIHEMSSRPLRMRPDARPALALRVREVAPCPG